MDDEPTHGLHSDGVHRKRDLGNFTIAGDFNCSRCMHGKASVDAYHGVVCRMCGNGAYDYEAVPRATWLERAIFRFADGRVEIRHVGEKRPWIWQVREHQHEVENVSIWDPRASDLLACVTRTFRRRDFAAGYGFIGPLTDSDYVEEA